VNFVLIYVCEKWVRSKEVLQEIYSESSRWCKKPYLHGITHSPYCYERAFAAQVSCLGTECLRRKALNFWKAVFLFRVTAMVGV